MSKSLSIDVFTNFTSEDVVIDIMACIQKFTAETCTLTIETSLLALNGVRAIAAWMLNVRTQFRVIFTVKDFIVGFPDFDDVSVDEAFIEDFTITKVSKGSTVVFEYYSVVACRKL